MKDNFSRQSQEYARFRPTYPQALYKLILEQVAQLERAWDCGTGNGQVAAVLAEHFGDVIATDISRRQLEQAVRKQNIRYLEQAAEAADFPPHYVDLITVGQAIHWFDHERFYEKVKSVLRPRGIIAEFGYQLFRTEPAIDRLIHHFYHQTVGPYWDPERRHIEDAYEQIPFPFDRLPVPQLEMTYDWTFDELTGYLRTWSAVQHFRRDRGEDPVDRIMPELKTSWASAPTRAIHFNILLRLGRNG